MTAMNQYNALPEPSPVYQPTIMDLQKGVQKKSTNLPPIEVNPFPGSVAMEPVAGSVSSRINMQPLTKNISSLNQYNKTPIRRPDNLSVIPPSQIMNSIAPELNVNISPIDLTRDTGAGNDGRQPHVMERRRSRNFAGAGGDDEQARKRF